MAPIQQPALLRNLRLTWPTGRPSQSLRRFQQPSPRFYAGQSYGGGQGDPKGENPQDQGANPATSDAEHPGPPPPDVGQGTGGGATKKDSQGHGGGNNAASSQGGGKNATSGVSPTETAAQPKIHSHDAPHPDKHSQEVKKHNEEMANRHEKPHEKSRDKEDQVDKGFWKGMLSEGRLH